MWYSMPMHPHVIINFNANHSYLIAHRLLVALNGWFLCCVHVLLFMHVRKAVVTLWPLRAIRPYLMPYCLHCVKGLLSLHKEVYLTLHPLWTKTNLFGRLQSVPALVSKFVCHLIYTMFILHMATIQSILCFCFICTWSWAKSNHLPTWCCMWWFCINPASTRRV